MPTRSRINIPSPGFTLVELLVTLFVAAVLLGIAVPSFQHLVENNRVVSNTNAFQGVLQYARSEASRRQEVVSLCPLNGGWSEGAYVVLGASCDGWSGNDPDELRRVSLDERLNVEADFPGRLTFLVNGQVNGAQGMRTITISSGIQSIDMRRISLLGSGASRVERVED
ncbi:GspH/FimT family pseudopilin [Alkalilimnicola ehrlichii MLHE-1]|uniref:Type II secretion system protein H n=1 Tax=Alkalilimnicola ehrlichii (strain ATCC BAA-1101 / DSM 17681 / MLHE-1) TaxID=187272 RepID=Q0AC29_ALKEH|nr:GspH/FimT family pseudopilin [Alkalilimnicola ehrlichii]ABI55608.1 putative type-4 fimbrial pilin related signal peptide protein [Alkalilimnicola ehrlichii MLHE-1]